jgi:hypothetical protein
VNAFHLEVMSVAETAEADRADGLERDSTTARSRLPDIATRWPRHHGCFCALGKENGAAHNNRAATSTGDRSASLIGG